MDDGGPGEPRSGEVENAAISCDPWPGPETDILGPGAAFDSRHLNYPLSLTPPPQYPTFSAVRGTVGEASIGDVEF